MARQAPIALSDIVETGSRSSCVPGLGKNGYLVIEATGGDSIESIGIAAPGNFADIILIDHVGWVIPAPGTFALLGLAGLATRRRRRA